MKLKSRQRQRDYHTAILSERCGDGRARIGWSRRDFAIRSSEETMPHIDDFGSGGRG